MPTPAARFLNAEKGSTAESKKQKGWKKQMPNCLQRLQPRRNLDQQITTGTRQISRDMEIWSRNLKHVQIILGQITRCNMVFPSMSSGHRSGQSACQASAHASQMLVSAVGKQQRACMSTAAVVAHGAAAPHSCPSAGTAVHPAPTRHI